MTIDSADEDGQFEQVLNRMDALMQRNYSPSREDRPLMKFTLENAVAEKPVIDIVASEIPVLTEIFHASDGVVMAPEILPAVMQPVALAVPAAEARLTRAEEVDFVLEELIPGLREMIKLIVQQELASAGQKISESVAQEAEQALRLHLLKSR